MSQESKATAVTIVQGAKAKEIEMLKIRPYVKSEHYCFRVFECDLKEVLQKLIAEEYIGKNCLVVTSPRAHGAAIAALPKGHYYTYVTDAKVKNLDDFVAGCKTSEYCHNEITDTLNSEIRDCLKEIDRLDEDPASGGSVIEAYQAVLWDDVQDKVDARARKADDNKYYLSRPLPAESIDTVIALGGGVAMDAGQYIANKLKNSDSADVKLLCIPTVLSVNAAFCYKAALRKIDDQGNPVVAYESGLIQPDVLLMDPSIILTAGDLNVVGAGDLLSCLTASFDWKLNSLVARNYTPNGEDVSKPFNQEVCTGAMELIGLLAEHIDELNAMRDYAKTLSKNKKGDKKTELSESEQMLKSKATAGLRFLGMAYHWVAEQSWIMQHTMWESASEHGMFDCMENVCDTEFTHGKIIGLCVYFMSLLQENEHERAVSMIKRLKLDITLNNMAKDNSRVTPENLLKCLHEAKAFLTKGHYRYTIISAKEMTDSWIDAALKAYYKDFSFDPSGKPNKGVEQYYPDYKTSGGRY